MLLLLLLRLPSYIACSYHCPSYAVPSRLGAFIAPCVDNQLSALEQHLLAILSLKLKATTHTLFETLSVRAEVARACTQAGTLLSV